MQITEWSLKRAANANILNCKYRCFYLSNTLHPISAMGKMKPSSMEICPLLSSLKTAGPLLHHQQLDLMSSDLPLRMDSVPAGRRANENPMESYTNPYLQHLGRQFSVFLKYFHNVAHMDTDMELTSHYWREGEEINSAGRKIEKKMCEGGGNRNWKWKSEDFLVSSSFFSPFFSHSHPPIFISVLPSSYTSSSHAMHCAG